MTILRILMVEDNAADAELAVRELKRAGMQLDTRRVECEQEFRLGLSEFRPHIILSDFSLPKFDGISALHIAREDSPDIPFVFVSGTIGEETAIESLKQGAMDYLIKSNLSRLASAVTGALERTEEKLRRKQAERELENSNRLFTTFMENLPAMVLIKDENGKHIFANRSALETLQASYDEIIGTTPEQIFSPEVVDKLSTMDRKAKEHGVAINHTQEINLGNQLKYWLTTTFPLHRDHDQSGHIGVIAVDITEQRKMEEALTLQHHAIEASATPVLIVDVKKPGMPLIYVNRAFETVTGYTQEEAMGRNCNFLQGHDRNQPELEKIRAAIRDCHPACAVLRNYRKDGSMFLNELYIAPVDDVHGGEVQYFVGVQNDITQIRQYQEALEHQANYDTLTGLVNRNLLKERIKQAFINGRRHNWVFTVAFIDIDNFKRVNDSLGHSAGDELIKMVGQRLQMCVRDGDTVARVGGDEFVLLLNSQTEEESSHGIMQRIREEISRPFIIRDKELTITCSIGLASFPKDGDNSETLLANADSAMYRVKASGRNSFRFYVKEMNEELGERLSLENDLWHALSKNELFLHYQPQINLKTGQVVGVEALMRWNHPALGLVAPLQFIPLMEENGLIVPIGKWVLETACKHNYQLQKQGLPVIRVAVNLSARQLDQKDLLDVVKLALGYSGMDANFLELEITESMIMHNVEDSIRILDRINSLGINLSLDDFGTGYSSLSYLKRLPIHRLKIDKSFIRDIVTDPNDAIISRSIIALAHSLQMEVIAEGVENTAQLDFLKANDCDEVQGYYYSKPLPFDELCVFLQRASKPH